jgi:hypothetical protein
MLVHFLGSLEIVRKAPRKLTTFEHLNRKDRQQIKTRKERATRARAIEKNTKANTPDMR